MPGRKFAQSGIQKPKKTAKRSKAKTRALNALAIAEKQLLPRSAVRSSRLGEAEVEDSKRKRAQDTDTDGEPGEEARQKPKRQKEDAVDPDVEHGSDSEGNQWTTGQVDDDDDSSLDSDEAFGKSDEERFEGFTFRGSSSRRNKRARSAPSDQDDTTAQDLDLDEPLDEPDDAEQASDAESEGFAAEAVDLAAALDAESGSSQTSTRSDTDGEDGDNHSELSLSDIEDGPDDGEKVSRLRNLVASLGSEDALHASHRQGQRAQEAAAPSEFGIQPRQKLTVADLLPTVTDPHARKTLKLMADSAQGQTTSRRGVPGKLEAPLPKRQQDRLDREAAYQKSKETLDRWIETVKQNRRAEHLTFPLPDMDASTAKSTKRLEATSTSKPMNDLEATIQDILRESGLLHTSGKTTDEQVQAQEELATRQLPLAEAEARRAELRRNRELLFREEIRAKRIKKIKSKAYRRVHRKERERNAQFENEALLSGGAESMAAEQERLDRLRAEERMGARHRDSKWARAIKRSGRAAWDEDAREGVSDMARRNEELRLRIEGKAVRDGDDISASASSDDDDDELSEDGDDEAFAQKLRQRLDRSASKPLDCQDSRLSSLKFMQKADAARRVENDEAVKQLQRELGQAYEHDESEEDEQGRQQFGPKKAVVPVEEPKRQMRNEFEERLVSDDEFEDRARSAYDPTAEIVTDHSRPKPRPSTSASRQSLSRKRQSSKEVPRDGLESNPWLVAPEKTSQRVHRAADNIMISSTLMPTENHQSKSQRSEVSQPSKFKAKPESTSKEEREKSLDLQPRNMIANQTDSDGSSFGGFSPTSSRSTSPKAQHPLTNQELIRRAFAADDILAEKEFADEKAAQAADDLAAETPGSQDTSALPGWGSWVGAGLSNRDRRKPSSSVPKSDLGRAGPTKSGPTNAGSTKAGPVKSKFMTSKTNSSNAATSTELEPRRDAHLPSVILSQKRVAKTSRYEATALPRPFESRAQYERSLRLPVGPEWVAGTTHRQLVRPRIQTRRGEVIPALAKPTVV